MTIPTGPYTTTDAGSYVDGAHGIYVTDGVVRIANAHGATIAHDTDCCERDETYGPSAFAGCEWIGDYEDQADAYMNDRYPVEGHYWGRFEGDWGLWAIESDDF